MSTKIISQQEIREFLRKNNDITSMLTNDDGPMVLGNDEFFTYNFKDDTINTEASEKLDILESDHFSHNYCDDCGYDSDSDETSQKLSVEYRSKLECK